MINLFKKILKSLGYAAQGIGLLFSTQLNAKVHLAAAVMVIVAGVYFEIDRLDWCIIILTICLVLSAEAFNSAIEVLCDLVHADYHPMIKKTKDMAAGGVLITALGAVVVAVFIFSSKLI